MKDSEIKLIMTLIIVGLCALLLSVFLLAFGNGPKTLSSRLGVLENQSHSLGDLLQKSGFYLGCQDEKRISTTRCIATGGEYAHCETTAETSCNSYVIRKAERKYD